MRLFDALCHRAVRRTRNLLGAVVAMEGDDVVMDFADPDVETGVLETMGHDGFVFLDKKDGVYYLTHSATLEQIARPSGLSYDLVFEEGFGAAIGFSADEENFVLVEDVFPRRLCKTAEGQLMVVETLPNKTSRIWNLTRTMQSYQEADLVIIAGDLLTEVKIDAYLVKWPRDQSRFFVGAQVLYTWGSHRLAGCLLYGVGHRFSLGPISVQGSRCTVHLSNRVKLRRQRLACPPSTVCFLKHRCRARRSFWRCACMQLLLRVSVAFGIQPRRRSLALWQLRSSRLSRASSSSTPL